MNVDQRRSSLFTRQYIVRLLLIVAMLAVAVFAILWLLTRMPPAYWTAIDGNDKQILAESGEFERNLVSQLSRVRDNDKPWQLVIHQKQINQWLAARLPRWLANRGVYDQHIRRIDHLMVNIEPNQIELAGCGRAFGRDQIVRMVYTPSMDEHGRVIKLNLRGLYIGRLPLPGETILDTLFNNLAKGLGDKHHEQLDNIRRSVRSIDLRLPLGDGRVVSVIDMQLTHQRAAMSCRTEFVGKR